MKDGAKYPCKFASKVPTSSAMKYNLINPSNFCLNANKIYYEKITINHGIYVFKLHMSTTIKLKIRIHPSATLSDQVNTHTSIIIFTLVFINCISNRKAI